MSTSLLPDCPSTIGSQSALQLLATADQPARERAWDQLVVEHLPAILATCRRSLLQGDDAEDVAQEVFLRALQAVDHFRGTARIGTWLHRIAVNCCLTRNARLRAERLRRWQLQQESPTLAADPDASDDQGDDHLLHRLLERLPPADRHLLELRYLQGQSLKQVAAELGIGLSACKMRLKRLERALRQRSLARAAGD
ncbi:MAG: RNA polymerase sigma factor [Planctomycetota bacterium]